MSRGCKSVSGHASVTRLFWRHPRLLSPLSTARTLGRDRSTERPSYPGQEEPGIRRPTSERHHASRSESSRGPGDLDAAKGQPTPQSLFRSRQRRLGAGGEASGAATPRDQPVSRPSGEEEGRAVETEDLGVLVRKSSSGIAIAAIARSFEVCCECGKGGCAALRLSCVLNWESVDSAPFIIARNVAAG